MHVQTRRQDDTSEQREEHRQRVKDERDDYRQTGEATDSPDDEGNHGESRHKHGKVDTGIGVELDGNGVADQCHGEEGEDEGPCSQSELHEIASETHFVWC